MNCHITVRYVWSDSFIWFFFAFGHLWIVKSLIWLLTTFFHLIKSCINNFLQFFHFKLNLLIIFIDLIFRNIFIFELLYFGFDFLLKLNYFFIHTIWLPFNKWFTETRFWKRFLLYLFFQIYLRRVIYHQLNKYWILQEFSCSWSFFRVLYQHLSNQFI